MVQSRLNLIPEMYPTELTVGINTPDEKSTQDNSLWHHAGATPQGMAEPQANGLLSALVATPRPTTTNPPGPGRLPRSQNVTQNRAPAVALPTATKTTSKNKRFSPYGNDVPKAKAARKDGSTVVPPSTSKAQTEQPNAPTAIIDLTVNSLPDVPAAVFDWNEVLNDIPTLDLSPGLQANAVPEDVFEWQNGLLGALVTDPQPTAMGPAAPKPVPRPQDLADLKHGAPAISGRLDWTVAPQGKRFSPYGNVAPNARAQAIQNDVPTSASRAIRPRAPKPTSSFVVVPCAPRRSQWEASREDLARLNKVYRERLYTPVSVPDAPLTAERPYIHHASLECAEHWRMVASFDWNNRHLPISQSIDYAQSIVHFLRYLEQHNLKWFDINQDRQQLKQIVKRGISEGRLDESVSNALKCLSARISCSFKSGVVTFNNVEVSEHRNLGA